MNHKKSSTQAEPNEPADPSGDLFTQLEALSGEGDALPPVHLWNPEHCYDIDMRIDSQGRWFYLGSEIKRERMIRLFSRVLKKEGDEYFLVTPVEKARLLVEDAPFMIVEMELKQQEGTLAFRTNLNDLIVLSADNKLVLGDNGLPYIDVRNGLLAKINRSVFYKLVDVAEEEEGQLWVQSKGERFFLGECGESGEE